MMPMCGQMQADKEVALVRLDKLTAAMNAAKGDKKVPAMAAVLNELVAQHKAMCKQMQQAHGTMSMMGMGKMGAMHGQDHRPPDGATLGKDEHTPEKDEQAQHH